MKNIDYVNKLVAQKLNIPLEIVDKVNAHYWNTVKQTMRNLQDESIYVKELGTISVSNFKLDRYIQDIRKYIKNVRQSPRFTEARKEKLISYYKQKFVQCLAMKKIADKSLHFKKTYKKCLPS